jgi:hypothetical protein
MKRIHSLVLAVSLLVAASAFADLDGAWTASLEEKRPDRIYMNITYGRQHQNGSTMNLSTFSGLTPSQINAATMTPVQFTIDREAGKIAFEGTFRKGKGAGQFTFTGNPAYPDAIRKLGVKFELERRRKSDDPDETLFALTIHDVSTAFIRSMQAEGYHETLEKYLAMRIFDITPEYIREMRSLGFKNIDADELVATRIHRVTPDYVRQMRAAGWDLSLEELQSSRIFEATPEFAEEMKKLGYGGLSHSQLVSFRIHRVTPEFITEMRKLGYKNLSADDLVSMRIHRVTPEFIHELEDAGYRNVPVEKLVAMRIHGIDVKYIKRMNGTN